MTEEQLRTTVIEELERKEYDEALWEEALGQSEGNTQRAEDIYIEMRMDQLRKESNSNSTYYEPENQQEAFEGFPNPENAPSSERQKFLGISILILLALFMVFIIYLLYVYFT